VKSNAASASSLAWLLLLYIISDFSPLFAKQNAMPQLQEFRVGPLFSFYWMNESSLNSTQLFTLKAAV
jgi:hypothetical protein